MSYLRIAGSATMLATAASLTMAETQKPNIVLIYADDLGAGLLGCYGQKIIKTPNIDKLAEQGMKFGFSHGCMYCAPARATLLTGLHDSHKGAWNITRGGLLINLDKGKIKQADVDKNLKRGIQAKPNEVFLPQLAQKAGYKTAQFGKLDWGFTTTHDRLKRHGWDHYLGYMDHQRAHGFYPTYLWHNGEKLPLPGNTHLNAGKTSELDHNKAQEQKRLDRTGKVTYSQNVFIDHILKFIDDNKSRPFFLFHSTQLPHGPVDVPEIHPDFVNNNDLTLVQKMYASMVKMLDDHVGLIMARLKKHGLDKNTMVVFTSDNGHELYYEPNKGRGRRREYHGDFDTFKGSMDLAGLKWSNWQGGIHVPLIVRWPGKIKAGAVDNKLLTSVYDYMPTFAEVMNVDMPKGKDGVSFLPTLLGKKQPARDYIIVNRAVITSDGWKLVQDKKRFYLFNLKKDPGERTDLAQTNKKRFNTLKAIFDREINSPRRDL